MIGPLLLFFVRRKLVVMRVKYVGAEDIPGSGSTVLFGQRVKIGEVVELPADQEAKYSRPDAKLPAHFELVTEVRPAQQAQKPMTLKVPPKPQQGQG